MAWALVDHDMWGVTARMNVEFKRPVPIGRPIRAEGRVLQVRRRLVEAEGVILDPADGSILARAQATFVGASEEKKQELKARYGFHEVPATAAQAPGTDRPERPTPWFGAMTTDDGARPTSAATERARALVAERMPAAVALGRAAGDRGPGPRRRGRDPAAAASPASPIPSTSTASGASPPASGTSSASAVRCSMP